MAPVRGSRTALVSFGGCPPPLFAGGVGLGLGERAERATGLRRVVVGGVVEGLGEARLGEGVLQLHEPTTGVATVRVGPPEVGAGRLRVDFEWWQVVQENLDGTGDDEVDADT